ncbi:MAG: hypothetical protein ACRCSN_06560, partial [Dermatophilaceae bacterium]
MADDYDEQLIEATRVRRDRLTQALLHGPHRLRRVWSDRVGTHLASAFVAVLACAVCVAVAFVGQLLESDPTLGRNRTASTTPEQPPSSTPSPSPQPSSPRPLTRQPPSPQPSSPTSSRRAPAQNTAPARAPAPA